MPESLAGGAPLPPWTDDPLDRLLADAEDNVRVTALNCPGVYAYLQRLHAVLLGVGGAIEKDNRTQLLIPRLLMIRCHGAIFSAMRLAMAGQLYEVAPLVRVAIEQAWYALHIARDPSPPERRDAWINRNDDGEATKTCKNEFTVQQVRGTHESLDPETAGHLRRTYERAIDCGAHPNQMGVLAWLESTDEGTRTTYQVGILRADVLPVVATLQLIVGAALGILRLFELIFPERFEIMGLDRQVRSLTDDFAAVFGPYVRASER